MAEPNADGKSESLASWLGINRATLAVLVVIGGLGLAEEIWKPFMPLHLEDAVRQICTRTRPGRGRAPRSGEVRRHPGLPGEPAGRLRLHHRRNGGAPHGAAHRAGRLRPADAARFRVSSFSHGQPWAIVCGGLLLTNWEPLSVPATFDVVGSEVPKNRRTIAFAVQSIQKRVPKMIGPWAGGLLLGIGFFLNLWIALGLVVLSVVLQAALLPRMKPKEEPSRVPLRQVLREMPPDLRALLTAEIFLRWGDWFIRDFSVLYVVSVLGRSKPEAGFLVGLTSFAALADLHSRRQAGGPRRPAPSRSSG